MIKAEEPEEFTMDPDQIRPEVGRQTCEMIDTGEDWANETFGNVG